MYNYAKTIDDLSEDTKRSFIETKEIRVVAAFEMLNSRMLSTKTKYNIEFTEMGLGDSIEFKGV
tara:strand:- start:1 stop:192 length:192 start_codon:yes stop_codon:yes gene_type:complete